MILCVFLERLLVGHQRPRTSNSDPGPLDQGMLPTELLGQLNRLHSNHCVNLATKTNLPTILHIVPHSTFSSASGCYKLSLWHVVWNAGSWKLSIHWIIQLSAPCFLKSIFL